MTNAMTSPVAHALQANLLNMPRPSKAASIQGKPAQEASLQQALQQQASLKEAVSDFAAIFVQKLMKHAFKAKGFMSGGPQAQAFYDQLGWEYSRHLAKRNDFGITGMIMKSLGGEAAHGQDAHDASVLSPIPNPYTTQNNTPRPTKGQNA